MKDDKVFRDKLHHHTIPVRDGLWDRIEAQLPPKKDRRGLPLFWFTLFTATLLSGSMMIGMLNNGARETSNTPLLPSPAPATPSGQGVAHTESAEIDLSIPNNLNQQTSFQSPVSDNNIQTKTNTEIAKNTESKSTLSVTPRPNTWKETEGILQNDDAALQNSLILSSVSNHANIATRLSSSTSFLPMAEMDLHEQEVSLLSVLSVKPDPNCYKFGGIGSDYALSADVFAGPGFSPKTFEENGGEPGYAEARKKTENYQYAWSAGARINLHHRSGLTARLGLTYTQAGDLFDYTDSLATQSTTRIDSFFAADGTFLYTESSQVLILGTLIKKIHNTYRYLDIPLLVGYELPLGRSMLMVNVGPVLNLTSSHKGQILDPMFHPRSISNGDPGSIDVYKTSLGLSIYLGAGVVIPISDHFSGIAEPSILYRLKPVTLGNYPLNEHRHYAGLNLGLRYHFN